jgi:outer membrane receptor for ferrienterochelin and colicins
MGGVINIITDRAGQNKKDLGLRLGSFSTVDANLNFSKKWGRTDFMASSNYNSSKGYSLKPNSQQKTVEPYWRSLQQFAVHHHWGDHWKAGVGLRGNLTHIDNTITVQNGGVNILSKGFERTGEFNATPYLSYQQGEKLKSVLRGYVTGFESRQALKVKSDFVEYDDQFQQLFMRLESQTDIALNKNAQLSLGGGYAQESVRSNRYDSLSAQRTNSIAYLFAQHEAKIGEKWTSILGFRFDGNQTYASVLSPKLSLQYKPSSQLHFTLSYGKGFKAPDFRQLYLNFTNLAAGAYSVFGTAVAATELDRLKQLGQLDQVTPIAARLADLKPEISGGFNAGIHFHPHEKIKTSIHLFRNDLSNMILTDIVAFKTNGGQIFSYFNINRVLTQGVEWDASVKITKRIHLNAGYQFLYTADKDVLESIREGKLFQRSATDGNVSRMRVSDYGGLPNRSTHNANLKLFYESPKGNFITLRSLYRSRWGTTDADGNGLINRSDEYANGFVQFNVSAGWVLMKNLKWMIGADNLLNYKDAQFLPGNPGRVVYMDLQFNF